MARSTELSRYRWLPVPRRHHYRVGEETLLLSWFMSSSGLQLLGALYPLLLICPQGRVRLHAMCS